MTSGNEKRVNYSRRFMWFALLIVLLIGLYTAAWYYFSKLVGEEVQAFVVSLNHDGQRASCEDQIVRGYPFRIGVFCRSVMFESRPAGVSFSSGSFRSAAQVYQPRHIVSELDGPAIVRAPGLSSLEFNWESLRSSVRLAEPMPERFSIESHDLRMYLDEPGDLAPLLARAETFEFHARPAEVGGAAVDLASRFSNLVLDTNLVGISDVPPLSGLVDLTLNTDVQGLRGRNASIRTITVMLDEETSVTVSGTAAVDMLGLVDAELELGVRNPQKLADELSRVFPQQRQQIQTGFAGLAMMGQATTLPLTISKGQMRLGFLPLGVIPPL